MFDKNLLLLNITNQTRTENNKNVTSKLKNSKVSYIYIFLTGNDKYLKIIIQKQLY